MPNTSESQNREQEPKEKTAEREAAKTSPANARKRNGGERSLRRASFTTKAQKQGAQTEKHQDQGGHTPNTNRKANHEDSEVLRNCKE